MAPDSAHIAFYCSSSSWGGLEINTLRYARWMKEAGFRTTVFAVAGSPLFRECEAAGHHVTAIRRNGKYGDIPNALRVSRQFRDAGVRLIWFRDTRDMEFLAWVKRLSGGRYRLLYQQAMQFGISKRDPFHTIRFSAIDAWVSTLHFLADQVRLQTRFPHERIHVVPLGSSLSPAKPGDRERVRQELGISPGHHVATVIGRIDPLKDQLCAVHALQFLHPRYPDAHLLICGESTRNEGGEYERMLRRHVNQLDLQSRVHFLPYTNDVAPVYAASDLFLLTSKGETFGTVTIEAMSCGLPVIGTDSSGTPEILDHGKAGLLYAPGNAQELSECWTRILGDESLRRTLGEAGRSRAAEYYSREASVRSLSAIVHGLTRN